MLSAACIGNIGLPIVNPGAKVIPGEGLHHFSSIADICTDRLGMSGFREYNTTRRTTAVV